ncbi:aminotransferase class V-fold PLP-dependent enzyme [Bosea lathyri]|uniref:Selenocysteine lyase/Cysteine desulfurase n=1 Tax=Bosea lathyri TaxID=1036778 RepID=A0A1H5ZGD7_9HYPH|nr:aminotransferase class V-fold PLP-dependent enzyme [Bosea lathyri]SEG35332.1 Selenocysteine lyase/Cysteine desulfurase [Bosea lathyri]
MTEAGDWTGAFARFRGAAPDRINLAAHSHHDWPDVTYQAQETAWADAARLAGDKWDVVFGEVIPAVQAGIARHLRLPDPTTIAFAPNTHEFLRRLLSCLPKDRVPRILTTSAEFHTARRQLGRLAEDGLIEIDEVPAEPFATLAERLRTAIAAGGHDLIYVSQVLFNSGATLGDLAALADAVPSRETLFAIDGYHGYLALPTDLSGIANRAFYIAGGYKYAMAGEGCCFMHCPPGFGPRPRDTGWFAAFGALAAPPGSSIGYSADGGRFMGATFDPSGLYRMRAVLEWMATENLDAFSIHGHAVALMQRFLAGLDGLQLAELSRDSLITPLQDIAAHGNFLAFRTPAAGALEASLAKLGIATDHRGDILRFGFGVALAEGDIDIALERIKLLRA